MLNNMYIGAYAPGLYHLPGYEQLRRGPQPPPVGPSPKPPRRCRRSPPPAPSRPRRLLLRRCRRLTLPPPVRPPSCDRSLPRRLPAKPRRRLPCPRNRRAFRRVSIWQVSSPMPEPLPSEIEIVQPTSASQCVFMGRNPPLLSEIQQHRGVSWVPGLCTHVWVSSANPMLGGLPLPFLICLKEQTLESHFERLIS